MARQTIRHDVPTQELEVLGLAKEVRLVGRREIEEVIDLVCLGGLVAEESFVVLGETIQPQLAQPAVQPALQHHLFRGGHFDAKMLCDECAEIRELPRSQCTGHVSNTHSRDLQNLRSEVVRMLDAMRARAAGGAFCGADEVREAAARAAAESTLKNSMVLWSCSA